MVKSAHLCRGAAGCLFGLLPRCYPEAFLARAAETCKVKTTKNGVASLETVTVKRYRHLQPSANRKYINNLPGALAATTDAAKEA